MSWWMWLLAGIAAGIMVGAKLQREAWIYFGIAKPWSMRVARGGGIEFDTPAARSALRRCNPGQRVHYYGSGDRCECGEHENIYLLRSLGIAVVVDPSVTSPRFVVTWPPEGDA